MQTIPTAARQPFYKSLYVQVLTAIIIGVLVGHFFPQTGEALKPCLLYTSPSPRDS